METPNEIFVFFMSNYSNSCKQILDRIAFIAPHFNTKIINIDNPETRDIVLNSTTYKIETVPAVLLIYPKLNQIQHLEGSEVLNLLNRGVEMVQQKLSQQQNQQDSPRGKTPLNKIVQQEYFETPETTTGPGTRTNIQDIIEDDEEEEEEQPVQQRRKIGKTTIFPDKQFAPTDDEGMISNNKYLPKKGEGHEEMMGPSSLSEVEDNGRDRAMIDRNMNYPPRMDMERSSSGDDDEPTKPSLKKGRGRPPKNNVKNRVKFVDEELENEENPKPKGMSMSEIMGEQGNGVAPNKERDARSASIRQNAESLMAARDQIMQEEEGGRKKLKQMM